MKLVFIRHGDPDYSIDSLTEKGWREAELLAKRIHKLDVKAFYCSPLGRAKDTAAVTLKLFNREAVICDWLREFMTPITDPLTGKPKYAWDFMPNYWTNEPLLYSKDDWTNAPVMKTGEIAENYAIVKKGIDDLLASHGYTRHGAYYLTEKGNTDTLVFFCHGGVNFAILSHLLGVAAPVLWQGFLYCAGFRYSIGHRGTRARRSIFQVQMSG